MVSSPFPNRGSTAESTDLQTDTHCLTSISPAAKSTKILPPGIKPFFLPFSAQTPQYSSITGDLKQRCPPFPFSLCLHSNPENAYLAKGNKGLEEIEKK